jgi:adenine phosphoribosyltransferase
MPVKEQLQYESYIQEVPDFPKPGIQFYDIAPLLADGAAYSSAIDDLAESLDGKITKVAGFDARGFIFAGALALRLGVGLVMLRKPGKLPGATETVSYDLEYGSSALEIQHGILSETDTVALVDDVIATGGTACAGIELLQRSGARILEFCAVIDIPELGGSARIQQAGIAVRSLVQVGRHDGKM